ncbi:hypothetical protein EWM64_g8778 [Hericium alpestre]|uniref:RecF/RecN/SMC N-terminal domain-containing protein n=1 Tax=Hericium alpestre TaxID=135208 RepID=A0A4Y9ZLS6_9AGAM|nr:hypothetical protein EWM64_g8778 [Hericium alpestre]
MAKRRAVDSDSEDREEGSSSGVQPKRARFDQHEPEVIEYQAESSQHTQVARPRARRRQNQDEEDVDLDLGDDANDIVQSGDQNAQDTEEAQARFEQEHEESIRNSIRNKTKLQGGVAKFGVIEMIEMHQFMCHKYLVFKLGPQINFIIGHNGSGKSAVLSAITVALGGKATATGRGNGLKSFIREGQRHVPVAQVTVQLKNQGDEAYKHDVYGDSIIVTRTFTKEGGSSYKIKSKEGKTISTKKEELSAICDHMNIQVDNPMNVLTQDAARQFLSASHPSDKYKFFLRGTQLSQLSEEYETCLENISQTDKVLLRKKEALPDLQEHYKEVSARFQEASKAREQRHKADELKKELAWAHVATKEEELRAKVAEHTKAASRLPRIQDSLDAAEAKFQAATQKVTTYEEEHQGLGNVDHLQMKHNEIQAQIRALRNEDTQLKGDQRLVAQNLQITKAAIAKIERQLAEENAKAAALTEEKRNDLDARFQQAKIDHQQAKDNLTKVVDEIRQKREEMNAIRNDSGNSEQELAAARHRVQECEEQIRRCRDHQKSSLSVYGRDMERVLGEIDRMQWHGEKPIGPFGRYIKAKEPELWAVPLRHVLGGLMSTFAVTDHRDRNALKNLLNRTGNQNINVVVSEVDLFDYSRGEPPTGYTTVLRAIEVSDQRVLRRLINSASIESVMLAPTRSEADRMLLTLPHGGMCYTAKDQYRVQRFGDGGGQSSPLTVIKPSDHRNAYFTNQNAAAQIKHWQEELQQAEQQYQEINRKMGGFRQAMSEVQKANQALESQQRGLFRKEAELKHTRDSLQNEINDNRQLQSAGYDGALEDQISERENNLGQFRAIADQIVEVEAKMKPLLEEKDRIKAEINQFDEARKAATSKVEDAAEERVRAQNEQKHWASKLASEQEKVKAIEAVVQTVQEEFELWTSKALEYCERVENPRKAAEVELQLNSVKKALEEREKKHGATVEEMTIEVNKAQAALESAQKDLKSMIALNKALKQSLRTRLEKWYDFRRHIAFRCKVVFQYHLSNRGYFGKVVFNHADGTLQLKVQTDDLNNTQGGNRDKDPRALSGGEKSFATICLLLAMWESIGSPIRCLDEFDVFMDAVNRRISMKMMIDTANSSDGKQYILITPQNMQSIHVGTTVRVHRMNDPERGQGTLATGVTIA